MSPRHRKPRRCGCKFKGSAFKPAGIPMTKVGKIAIRRDELEALKLCDLDGLTQEEAGTRMGVSRGTVQRILAGARKKTAEALSQCKAIVLEEVICKEEVHDENMFPRGKRFGP
ncbi:MAG: DUF134 domain-containing protein [Nitrospirae bacterium]|nr:DUF134 domain-containing protein [Nitrospirota bacterium]